MDEVTQVLAVLKHIQVDHESARKSRLGKFLESKSDEVEFDSFDLYFNHNQPREDIDLQVGNYTFNFREWNVSLQKLSELLLLKGVRASDLDLLKKEFDSFHAKSGVKK